MGNQTKGRRLETLELDHLTGLVSIASESVSGQRNTCVRSSWALKHVLDRLGYRDAKLTRVALSVHHRDRLDSRGRERTGVSIGGGDGSRRPAAEPGMWAGHLVVTVGNHWLLDPTLGQAGGQGRKLDAAAVFAPWDIRRPAMRGRHRSLFCWVGNCEVRWDLDVRQAGFSRCPQCLWKPIAEMVLNCWPEAQRRHVVARGAYDMKEWMAFTAR